METTSTSRLTGLWLFLLAATAATYALGEMSGVSGLAAALSMLAIAFVKCRFVAWDFMGLRHASLFWRILFLGWLSLTLSLIAYAFRLGATP